MAVDACCWFWNEYGGSVSDTGFAVTDELKAWEERASTGEVVGRDPRKMSEDQLLAVGHKPMSPLNALRLRCLDCCAGSAQEVRFCVAKTCASWPFRTGQNPWRTKKTLTDEQKRELSERLSAARVRRRVVVPRETGDAE